MKSEMKQQGEISEIDSRLQDVGEEKDDKDESEEE